MFKFICIIIILLLFPVVAFSQELITCEERQDQLITQYGSALSATGQLSSEIKKLQKEIKELKIKLEEKEKKEKNDVK